MKKILVAHSDKNFRDTLRGHLEHNGYFTECSASAPEAIRLGLTLAPDLLLCHWQLEGETGGWAVCTALQRHQASLVAVLLIGPQDRELAEHRAQGHEGVHLAEHDIDREQLDELLATLLGL